jgi:hypothetical protein
MQAVTTIGLDIAKWVFQVHGMMCASSVQVSTAGTKLRNDWNKSLVGKPCTTSSGRTGVWTPDCTQRKVPWGPTSTCLHMTIVCE